MMNRISTASLFAVLVLGCAHAPAVQRAVEVGSSRPSALSATCQSLEVDLRSVHETMMADFPGIQDDDEIRRRAEDAFARGVAAVGTCRSSVDYVGTIKRYFAAFRDPHVKARWSPSAQHFQLYEMMTGRRSQDLKPGLVTYAATGVLAARLGPAMYVRAVDRDLLRTDVVAVGDEIVSCDDVATSSMIDEEILPFEAVSSREAARYRYAPNLFFRWDKEPGQRTRCQFRRANETLEATLAWSEVGPDYLSRFESHGPIYEVFERPYGHRVKLSSFMGFDEKSEAELERFVREAPRFRGDRVIVVDVRGNGGGNGTYGTRWIEGLFGFVPPAPEQPDRLWASPGNLRALRNVLLAMNGKVEAVDLPAPLRDVLACLEAARGRFAECQLEKAVAGPSATKPPGGAPLFSGRLYVLTDAWCLSSTETFVDQLRSMGNAVQVGVATDASTKYGSNIRLESPPSGLFYYSFSTGASSDLHHASGLPLVPQIQLAYDATRDLTGGDALLEHAEQLIADKVK